MPSRVVLERAVKRMVSGYLLSLQMPGSTVRCFFRRPVPYGFDASGLDYEGCVEGHYFSIETKSPDDDADLTPRQRGTAMRILDGGGKVFIISCTDGLLAFKHWVEQCRPI